MTFCDICNITVPKYFSHKKSYIHKSNCLLRTEFDNVQIIGTAFKNRILSYRVCPSKKFLLPEQFLSEVVNTICNLVKRSLEKHNALKINFELFATFTLPKNNEKSLKSFNTKYVQIFQSTNIKNIYLECVKSLLNKLSEFEHSESGWSFDSLNNLEVNINKYNPLRTGSYIPLPIKILKTRSCVNIKNSDDKCFLWSILAHMYPTNKNFNRVSSYPHYSKVLKIDGMSFPPSFEDITLFEKNNSDISVNIYSLEKNGDINGPLYKTSKRKLVHVNLLYITKNNKRHFCLIRNFERLVHSQLTKNKSKIFLCEECFIYFNSEEKLCKHNCARIKTVLPEKNSKLYFDNYERTQRIPIVIYGDFESLLREYSDKSKSGHTETIQVHEATSFAYYICCESKPELNELVSYIGANCAQKFVETISNDVKRLHAILLENNPMKLLTETEKKCFHNAKVCCICKQKFTSTDKIVADHDHFTGEYRGAAHNICKLSAKKCPFIPIIFHNLSNYDCHLFIKELASINGRINIIPKNKEKYISFTKFISVDSKTAAQLKFIDSFNFLSCSLDKLARSLHQDDFVNLRRYYSDQYLFDLICRKGVYCYDYIDSLKRYDETELPKRKHFFNKLTSELISEEDYKHALKVWKTFKIKNLGEYTDLYLKCDVLLLADSFEKFRKISLATYCLDPCYYVSSPSLSWDAMLLHTNVKLDLITDVEMYQMIEKGIRGGLAQCSLRYAKANNKYMSDYDINKSSSFLVYLDCVNLYGYAMMMKLPTSNFKFLNKDQIETFEIDSITVDSNIGYILEVDLSYPSEIHDAHSDLPFAAEKFTPFGHRNAKLIANLYDKCSYVIHYIHLKECLKNGLKLLKIHRILSFEQKEFLKPYIELNTSLRQKAESEFEKDFFKKQNNAIFGKTIENKRKQVNVKLVNTWTDKNNKTNRIIGAEKYVSAPNFKCLSIFTDNLVAIQLEQTKLILDRPIYVGFTVLELAKTHLYNFHYSIMKPLYKENIELCYTDTDSLLYRIYTDDFYSDMKKNIKFFDTSNFSDKNVYNIPQANMKIPGFFKDEMGGDVIVEFVGLRAKLYCIESQKMSIKKAKGVTTSVTKRLDIDKYKNVLYYNQSVRKNMCVIRSKNHNVYTQKINKLVLNSEDDKRQILKKQFKTLPWGHYSTIF